MNAFSPCILVNQESGRLISHGEMICCCSIYLLVKFYIQKLHASNLITKQMMPYKEGEGMEKCEDLSCKF